MIPLLLAGCLAGSQGRGHAASDALYFVLVDRFADGDPSNDLGVDRSDPQAFHGGDLRGLIEHLDEIQDLGAGGIWLSPVWLSRHEPFGGWGAYHGYWVLDPGAVDPAFGGEDELAELSRDLHRRGMKLVLDVVWNHVAPGAPLLARHPGWFHDAGSIGDWEDPVQVVEGQVHGLPDLAQEREPVRRYLLERTLRILRIARPDALRVDALRHMPASFVGWMGRRLRREQPGLELLGELFDGRPARVAAAMRDGGLDRMFDFPVYFALVDAVCRGAPVGALGAVLSQDRLYPDARSLVTFLDDHDLPRVLTACGGDRRRVERALRLLVALRGTPCLTYGTEAGLQGAAEPENRGDMGFGGGDPLREAIRELLRLRGRHPALLRGVQRLWAWEPGRLALLREGETETALVAVDLGGGPWTLASPWGGRVTVAEGEVALRFGPRVALPAPREVRLRVSAEPAPLGPGDRLLLSGSSPELGGWDPHSAVPLLEEGGRMRAELRVPGAEVLSWKLLVRRAGGAVEWSAGPNRYAWMPADGGGVELAGSWLPGG